MRFQQERPEQQKVGIQGRCENDSLRRQQEPPEQRCNVLSVNCCMMSCNCGFSISGVMCIYSAFYIVLARERDIL